MSYQPGERVLAIRNGEGNVLYVFGEGTYVGDRPRPGSEGPVPAEDYEAIKAMFEEDDKVPIEEHRTIAFVIAAHALEGSDHTEGVEQVKATILEDRAKPMDQRVEELYRETCLNPCIHLDSGDVVWGMQCWWGSLEGANRKYPVDTYERIVVPVPEGNGRWDTT